MKLSRCLLYLIVFFFSAVFYCSADTYVAQNAAGASSGADCADAHPASWFNSSANWGTESGKISPGTTVHLCGTISTNLTVSGSGSSGSPVTVLFESGANLTQSGCGGPFISMSNLNYVTVDGGTNGTIQNSGCATTGTHGSSKGIVAQSCTNCEIRNLTIMNIYIHSGSNTEIDQTQSNCIVYSGDNFSIHDNTLHDAGWCLYLQGSGVNNRIYNNNLYNIDHGIIFTPSCCGATAGPIYIYNNHIHDYANWDNSSNGYHHDGIHCYTVPSPYPQSSGTPVQGAHMAGFWLYNNLFDGNVGGNATGHVFLEPGVQTDGTATPCMDSTSQLHIFGNVLIGNTANGNIDLGRDSAHPLTTPIDFFDNTVFGSSAANGREVVFENVKSANTKNNIVGGANKLWDGVPYANLDYNGYINCPPGTSFNCWPVSSGSNNFSTWLSQCACDANAVNSQANTGGVDQSTGTLAAGSVMIGVGTNLTNAVSGWPSEQQTALTTDRNGAARGDGNWDIGALSFGSTEPTPPPPTNLSGVPQ